MKAGTPVAEVVVDAQDQEGGNGAANRRPGVEQGDGPPAFLPRKPLGHGLGRAGPVGRLTKAEQEAERGEAAKPGRQRRQHRRSRVESHARRQARAGPEAVQQPARHRLPPGVGDAERDDQHRKVGVAPLELGLDVRRQHRQRLPIDVVDDGGKKQQPADVPAQPHARPRIDADSRSTNNVVSACVCRIEAGTRGRDRAVHRLGDSFGFATVGHDAQDAAAGENLVHRH